MQVEGVKYNGIQKGPFGLVPDQLVYTDDTTHSTFYVAVGASVSLVAYIRDLHRANWKRQETKHGQK